MNLNDKKVQNTLLFLVVLLALIPALLERTGVIEASEPVIDSPVMQPAAPQAAPAAQTPNRRPMRFAKSVPSRTSGIMEEEILTDAPEELGARSIKLVERDGSLLFQTTLIAEPRCMEGDFDIIRKEVNRSANPKVLLTVEPLDDGMGYFEPIVHELYVKNITPGANFNFALPVSGAARHFGLYMCKDSSNAGRCRGKKVVDLAELSKKYAGSDVKGSDPIEDKIYYFHFFVIQGGELMGFDNLMEERNYPALTSYLRARTGLFDPTLVDEVKSLNTVLQSMPARITRREIQINLPRHERGKCQAKELKLPLELMKALEVRGGEITAR